MRFNIDSLGPGFTLDGKNDFPVIGDGCKTSWKAF
jgi:hypothetical protein